MSKTDDVADTSFKEIATISDVSPHHVDVKDSLGANVTGDFTTPLTAHISYRWRYPTHDVLGQYTCTVHGMDKLGHLTSLSSDVVIVQEEKMDIATVLMRMRRLEVAQEKLQKDFDQQTKELGDMKKLQNMSKTLLTGDKVEYRGHEYMVSTTITKNVPVADVMCRTFGGYLVEIDDADEFKVVQDLVRRSGSGNDRNIIGGTDEGTEGKWRFQYSQKAMTFFDWHTGYNGTKGASANCLFLSDADPKMYDFLCVDLKLAKCICEIPLL